MKKLNCILSTAARLTAVIFLLMNTMISGASAQPAKVFIGNAYWLNTEDHDMDGYRRSGELWFDPNNFTGSVTAYAKIYGKLASATFYTLYKTTPPFVISGLSSADQVMVRFGLPSAEVPHGIYDIMIEIFQESNDALLLTYGPNQDGDLNDEKFERVAEDPDPTIQVSHPNGGEILVAGNNFMIDWTYGISGNVRIELFKSGVLYSTIAASTACDGTYIWTVPPTLTPGTDYQVKISSLSVPSVTDMSDNPFTVTVSDIQVTSPNGGEIWVKQTAYEITWIDQITENVRIELLRNGQVAVVIASSTPSDGSFTYTPSAGLTDATTYRIRIRSVSNAANSDISDNDFTINGGGIQVTSPNGGEQWLPGSTHLITWNDNIPGNVRIQLYNGDALHTTIASSTPSDGEYSWTISSSMSGENFKIRISSVSSSGTFDLSDTTFSIGNFNALELISPNGGEHWAAGASHDITWSCNISANVRIQLYKGNALHTTIASSTPCDGSHSWSIPAGFELGNDYKIKITSVANATVYDISEADFSVVSGGLSVTSPNGGETWLIGTVHDITWTDELTENVRIQLFKGGVLNATIASSTPSDGLYSWTLPTSLQPGSDYTVKISSVANTAIYDESDAPFSVIFGNITVNYPNGGETFLKGSTMNINWTDDFDGNVSIKLYKNGVLHTTIASSTPSDGHYAYSISNSMTAGGDYRIRISHVSSSVTYDESNADFNIVTGNIEVAYPNGNEEFFADSLVTIQWTSNFQGKVKIQLIKYVFNTGTLFGTLADSTDNDGTFDWQLSPVLTGNFKIKISACENNNVNDMSDQTFEIYFMSGGKLATQQTETRFVNPVRESVTFFLHSPASQVMINLFDMSGRCVLEKMMGDLDQGEQHLPVDRLPEGLYMVMLRSGNSVLLNEKLVIMK